VPEAGGEAVVASAARSDHGEPELVGATSEGGEPESLEDEPELEEHEPEPSGSQVHLT
jgi:hypothetical protein